MPYILLKKYRKLKKNMLLLRLTFLGIVAIVTVNATLQEDMDEAKMDEMYNCFFAILCDARKPLEFRRIMLKADPKLIKCGFKWLEEISNITGSDTPEFWASYPDYKCHLPPETKKLYFMEWMKRLGEYWAEACADADSEACVMMGHAENEYNIVTAEYHANNVCQGRAVEMGEKKMEEGKEAMGKGMEGGKNAMEGGKDAMEGGKDVMEGFAKKGGKFGK